MTLADELADSKLKESLDLVAEKLSQEDTLGADQALTQYLKDLDFIQIELSTTYLCECAAIYQAYDQAVKLVKQGVLWEDIVINE